MKVKNLFSLKNYWIWVIATSLVGAVIYDLFTPLKWYEIFYLYLVAYAYFMFRLEALIDELKKRKK